MKEENFRAVWWEGGKIALLDQNQLPQRETPSFVDSVEDLADAIMTMKVRGAPAIGIAAAYGVALAAWGKEDPQASALRACDLLARTRPTAVNLFWSLQRMRDVIARSGREDMGPEELKKALLEEAEMIAQEQDQADRLIGKHGASLLPAGCRALTHCNAGGLATLSFGTALGVIKTAYQEGKLSKVWVDETRPLLQGSRLTAWELEKCGIPYTVICDNMAGFAMSRGEVDAVVVGADRIARNGDTANKIGTYSLAVLARHHDIPLYVAAPLSTLDLSIADGGDIVIEERSPGEVGEYRGIKTVPEGAQVWNPAFDITPASLITAIVTEAGVAYPPFAEELGKWAGKGDE